MRHVLRPAFAIALAMLAAGTSAASRKPADTAVSVWGSSADESRKLQREPDLALGPLSDAPRSEVVLVEPDERHQLMVGFGAAMTDASAELFQTVLPRAARDRLFAELFGRDGLALSFLRVPIGASDFSSEHYSLDDMPPGQADPELSHFSMARPMQAQIPALKAARAINPGLALMATPWSAPGWMKDSGSLIQGRLRPDYYPAFAAYFGRYLDAMARQGLPVRWISVQNEPHFEPKNYPGMRFEPADRARFIGQFLGPLLARRSQPVGILDWDHNWDQPESPLAVLADPLASRYVTGIAWHCYAGEASAMAEVRKAHPDKDVFFTECSGGDWAPKWGDTLGWMTDNLVIAATRSGSRGTLLWNLALDEKHGPHLGGCGDCRGVVTIDRKSGPITRNVEYYVLGHASRFLRPGARHIASSETGAIANVAFRNPDGSLVLLAHNRSEKPAAMIVRENGREFRTVLPAGEVVTVTWQQARKNN